MKVNTVCIDIEKYDEMNLRIVSLESQLDRSKKRLMKVEDDVLEILTKNYYVSDSGEVRFYGCTEEILEALGLDPEIVKRGILESHDAKQ